MNKHGKKESYDASIEVKRDKIGEKKVKDLIKKKKFQVIERLLKEMNQQVIQVKNMTFFCTSKI